MLFDDRTIMCLGQKIKDSLYSKKVLQALRDGPTKGLLKVDIQKQTGYSRFIVNETINQLEGGCFIDYVHYIRGKMYFLTDNGKQLIKLLSE